MLGRRLRVALTVVPQQVSQLASLVRRHRGRHLLRRAGEVQDGTGEHPLPPGLGGLFGRPQPQDGFLDQPGISLGSLDALFQVGGFARGAQAVAEAEGAILHGARQFELPGRFQTERPRPLAVFPDPADS